MESYPKKFNSFAYYEHLRIAHLFDTVHIENNVAETLWRILDGRSNKEKIVKISNDIQEANHAMKDVIEFHRNGELINIKSIPWILMEQQSNAAKEVMQKIKFPTGLSVNMKNIITKKGDFAGVKTHDWNIFMKGMHIIIAIFFILVHIVGTYFL